MRRLIVALAVSLTLAMAGLTVAPAPARAAVPDAWGFAFMHNPAPLPGTILDISRQWGSWKVAHPADWAKVTEIAFGRYRVTFPHIASIKGVAHVTAVSGDARWCQVLAWATSGLDEVVDVQCYRNGGFPDRARFAVVYSTSSGLLPIGGGYAYVYANPLGGTVHSYNSAGAVNSVTHIGAGQYRVVLPGLGGASVSLAGNLQVTAVHPNSPRRCKVAGWGRTGADYVVTVYCHSQANVLTDSWFNLTYHDRRSVFGALNPPKYLAYLWTAGGGATNFNSQGGANTVVVSGVGQYLVTFDLVGVRETHVQVTAYGTSPDYCLLQDVWQLSGSTVLVRNVICFNGAGVQSANNFFITYSSRL